MFERFSGAARAVVVGARDSAREFDHRTITTPHLLLALLGSPAAEALVAHGVTAEAVRGQLADLVAHDPRAADDDAAALAALGIDVARIRAAVEANFGPGALDRPLPDERAHRGLLGRLRRGRDARPALPRDEVEAMRPPGGGSSGHLPFSPAAKKALELSLREALRLGDHHIGPEHLVLGLLRCGDGAAAAILDRLGTDVEAVRRDVQERDRRSA